PVAGVLDDDATPAGAGKPAATRRCAALGVRWQTDGRVSGRGARERVGRQPLPADLGWASAAVQLSACRIVTQAVSTLPVRQANVRPTLNQCVRRFARGEKRVGVRAATS